MPIQADQLHQFGYASINASWQRPLVLHAKGNVLCASQVGEKRIRLKHDAKIATRWRQGADVVAVLYDTAR